MRESEIYYVWQATYGDEDFKCLAQNIKKIYETEGGWVKETQEETGG